MPIVVVTPAKSQRLTTVRNACTDLGITPGAAADVRINRFIAQASGAVVRHCRRSFGLEVLRETISPRHGQDSLTLGREVRRITGVSVGGVAQDEGVGWEFAAGSLFRVVGGRRACWQARPVLVEYETGWILPDQQGSDLPHDVERAAILLVGGYLTSTGRDPLLRSENVQGVGSFSYATPGSTSSSGLGNAEAEALLAPYEMPVVG